MKQNDSVRHCDSYMDLKYFIGLARSLPCKNEDIPFASIRFDLVWFCIDDDVTPGKMAANRTRIASNISIIFCSEQKIFKCVPSIYNHCDFNLIDSFIYDLIGQIGIFMCDESKLSGSSSKKNYLFIQKKKLLKLIVETHERYVSKLYCQITHLYAVCLP